MPAMSVKEMRCFKAAMRFQRQEILFDLLRNLYPKLPFIDRVRVLGMVPKLLYSVLVLALIPLLSLLWLLYIAFQLLALPYRYLSATINPPGLRGPGERNLQGVHNAFSKYLDLSPTRYVECVNEWIGILYGDRALDRERMENYLGEDQLKVMALHSADSMDLQMRCALTIARETLSQKLGNY